MKHIDPVQAITQVSGEESHAAVAGRLCASGVTWVQLRVKSADPFQLEREAVETVETCREWGATCIINDHVNLAMRVQADGVHLGLEDMPVSEARRILGSDKIIGATAHTIEEALRQVRDGADYIGVGPLRFTPTKKNLRPALGYEGYETIMNALKKHRVTTPVIAVGGVTPDDVLPLRSRDVYGVAVSSWLTRAEDPRAALMALRKSLKENSHVENC